MSSHEIAQGRGAGHTTQGARLKTFLAVNFGNTLEWYDWTVFATFAVYFADDYFHGDSDISMLLSAFAVFAVGFVMRPLGGVFFGRLADRKGRTFVLVLTMSMVAGSSLLIAFGPTFGQVGALASIWLVLARCAQGFAHGGELGGSYTYIAEYVRPRRRAFWGSTIIVSTVFGTLLATLLGAVLRGVISEQEMESWGWRIPFVVGGVLGLVALYLRRSLADPEVFTSSTHSRAPETFRQILRGIWAERSSVLRVMAIVAGTTLFAYTWSVSAPAYAISFYGVDDQLAMWAGVGANVVFVVALPLAGLLADRIGRRRNVLLYGVIAAMVVFPLTALLGSSALSLLIAASLALIVQSLGASVQVAWFAELFSTSSRATGIGTAVSLSAAIFGGTAPYLNSWLTSIDLSWIFTLYSVALVLLCAVAALFTPETKGISLRGTERDRVPSSLAENG